MENKTETNNNEIMLEDFCDKCDEVLNVILPNDEFQNHKVGRIRCSCGHVVKPCNECMRWDGSHWDCEKCPWEKAEICNPSTDEEYFAWLKENQPELFNYITSSAELYD